MVKNQCCFGFAIVYDLFVLASLDYPMPNYIVPKREEFDPIEKLLRMLKMNIYCVLLLKVLLCLMIWFLGPSGSITC